ncbi:MAG TPA: hypothetical protein PLJ42_09420 [Chitinophagales bacterium]|jgi:hypothetical protein|nr:hypothetical protein [Chitinophagales bacterium]MBP6154215.1 hypothetical protein [Chitinophagales bacterium]HQV77532.1 hypothetical protein [Chitinophagales bacterium]HQW79643.1 hypothetical protein [Chitinophagales bacterium]HRB67812.1 hypothetical protein [Chitinophagales bacterium]
MKRIEKIIKEIVRQQIQYVAHTKKQHSNDDIRKFTYQQFIITEDGIGKHK